MEIKLEGITKKYGKVIAVEDFNLGVEDGELVVFLGPSGCGKSTTLYCIAGLEHPDQGKVSIGKKDVTLLPPKDRNVAMVLQSIALFPHLSVEENISFGLRMRKQCSKDEIFRRVRKVASLLQIESLVLRMPHELSGGQQQRATIARALVQNPAVFLMDEPFANLDARLKLTCQTELRRLNQKLGMTIIHVTHDQEEAMSIADRIVVMNGGRIEQIGTPMEVYFKPKNRLVAGFIGSPPMNIFDDCKFTVKEGRVVVTIGEDLEIPLPLRLAQKIQESGLNSITIAIRPEDVHLVESGRKPSEEYIGSLKMTIEVIEDFGREIEVYFDKNGEKLTGLFPPSEEFQVGNEVCVTFKEKNLYLFDSDTDEILL